MAEAGNTATPPAASGGIDTNALSQAIATALATALPAAIAEANKPMVEALRAQQPAAGTQGQAAAQGGQAGAAKAQTLTEQDVARIVGDQLKSFQQTTQQTQARERYQADKLKDLPAAYRNQLGPDPAKWAAEEQQIRDQYKADFGAVGGQGKDVGGDQPGGQKPAATIDTSKLSPAQKIELGLRSSKPQRTGADAGTAAAPATGTAAATTTAATGAAR